GLVGPDRDLGAVAGLARDRLDLDHAFLDLGHLHLEQALEQPRVRAADHDLWALGTTTDLGDVGLEPLAVAVGLRGHLLRLGQQRFDLAEIEQGVATLGLLHDAGHDVALAAGELFIGHLTLRIAELLEDHLLGGLRADPAAEVLGDLDFLLGQHLHLDALAVLGIDLLEHLLEHAHLAGLRVDLGAEPDEVVIGVGVLLLPRGLVRGRHGFVEALQDRLEGDPLLAFELAEVIETIGTRRGSPSTSITTASSSTARRVPTWTRASSMAEAVRTFTVVPTARVNCAAVFSGCSIPGELTSSSYRPSPNPS